MRQKPTSPVARVADTDGNTSEARNGGGFESVLEKNGAIEMAAAQIRGELRFSAQTMPTAGRVVRNQLVAERLAAIEARYPRPGGNRDVSVGERHAQGLQSRDRHDRVADPVCRSNQYVSQPHVLHPG
jgi:hypothetical protein